MKSSEHVILLGDHFQLPPTVLSEKAAEKGLRKVINVHFSLNLQSLFSRLAECGVEPVLLRIQYRMHPLISQFSSQTFYGGKIEDGVKAEDKPLVKLNFLRIFLT